VEAILTGQAGLSRADALPPHTRMLVAIAATLAVVLSNSVYSWLGYLLLACWLWKQSMMSFKAGIKRLLMIDGLIVLTILPLPFSYVGEQVIQLGPLALSEPGLLKAGEVFVKATLSAMIMMAQLSGMSELELSKALFSLKVPSRFILLLQFSVRYISVMHQETAKLRLAMRARGLGSGPTLHNWKSYGYLFGMLFVKALARADRIWFAMKCRGYRGYFPTSSMQSEDRLVNRSALIYLLIIATLFAADLSHVLAGFAVDMD